MTAHPLAALTAHQMLAAFAQGTLTPSTLLEALLMHIAAINPAINALTAFDIDAARDEAALSTQRWAKGQPKGLLDGLPIGVKDLQETKGLLTTYGNPRSRNHVPAQDLPMVARLRAAGAIVLAKTNVPELGAGGNTRNPVWGATGNPFNPALIVGGSSGGSAAALAADLVPLATGSDTGGSLRLPAALCGIVGYRPSVDVIAHPTRPLGWSAISVLGPMARTVDDLVLMLRACHGFDPGDPLSAPSDPARFDALPPRDPGTLRLGYSEDFGGAPVDPQIRATFRARLAALKPDVAELRPVDLNLGDMDRAFDILRAESFVAAFGTATQTDPDNFGLHIHANVQLGLGFTLADRAWAHAEQTRILRQFNARIAGLDAILLPTAPVSPFPWTQSHATQIDGQDMDIYYRWLALTYRGSLTGGPAITLPSGLDPEGMPFGLQLLGPVRGDAGLLACARSIEALLARDPATARPRPDLDALTRSTVDLRAIVTHPPQNDAASAALSAPTAV
ncbi:amidase [Pararhodobacter zhoushanensis]|uniref:amidase n=1 Tax=Pararhodobacter zhoushanensis TaxID=2479545 RepID=UPI000F8C4AD3|nr:amidase [Pararhodobacter zhoushanensis]